MSGLTIASGILGIIGIPIFVNAVVSFIAVARLNKKPIIDEMVESPPEETTKEEPNV